MIDITPVVSHRTAVFPGDVAFKRSESLSFASGHHLTLSSIETTLHIGAHADAPSHYHAAGASIAERDPMTYIGRAQVIEVNLARGERIRPAHLGATPITAPRVLFKTLSYPNPECWNGDFNSLSPELVDLLAGQGVCLVGIDTPSIDPADDQELPSHQAVYRHDLAVLEGLDLSKAEPGDYLLVAPPLRLEGADSSPVRALLLPPKGLASDG